MKTLLLLRFQLAALLLFTMPVYAQEVGLVLSGGGAKGVAHIGVIRALEEAEIPIDYITGTSMGAIIGGLYAAGYSPEQMYDIVTSEEFMQWVRGEIDKEYFYYFKQTEPDASWLTLRFQVDSTITSTLPSSLVSPVQMDFAFMEFMASASAESNYDFDSLFIPFRCIASDIADNQEVVLEDGDLGMAIRASMTFPFYFKPIRIGGKLLLDGGMYNNFPSDIMYDVFFPDIIIGSKVASNYEPPKEDDIISQLQTVFMENTEYSILCDNGVLIEPDLEAVNITDFSKTRKFIDSGYAATRRYIPEIREFVFERVSTREIDSAREEYRRSLPDIRIDSIHISGLNTAQKEYVRRSLAGRTKRELGIDELRKEYFKLIADDKIASVFPSLRFNKEKSLYDLHLLIKRDNNLALSFGGVISSSPTNEAFVELQYKYLGKQAITLAGNSYIGRFYNSAQIRTRIDYPGKVPFYLRAGFSLGQYDYFKTSTYFFEDKTPSYLIKNENNIYADLGWPITNIGKLEIRVATGFTKDEYYQDNFFTREDTADQSIFDFSTVGIFYELNSLEKKQYAGSGFRLSMGFSLLDGSEEYVPGSTSFLTPEDGIHHSWYRFRMQSDNYFRIGRDYSLGIYADLLISSYGFLENYTATLLSSPAFEPIPESMTKFLPAYRAHNFLGGGIKNIFRLANNIELRLEGFLFQPFQEIQRAEDGLTSQYGLPFSDRSVIASGAFVYHSPIGPVSASLNFYDKSEEHWSFMFNIGYIIFNRSPLN